MVTLLRSAVGLAAMALLTYFGVAERQDGQVLLGLLLVVFAGGIVIGSRWPLAAAPTTSAAMLWVHWRIHCPTCHAGQDPGRFVSLLLAIPTYGLAVLGAATGTLLVRWLTRTTRVHLIAARHAPKGR